MTEFTVKGLGFTLLRTKKGKFKLIHNGSGHFTYLDQTRAMNVIRNITEDGCLGCGGIVGPYHKPESHLQPNISNTTR